MTSREITDYILNSSNRIDVIPVDGNPRLMRKRVRYMLNHRGYWRDVITLATVDNELVAKKETI